MIRSELTPIIITFLTSCAIVTNCAILIGNLFVEYCCMLFHKFDEVIAKSPRLLAFHVIGPDGSFHRGTVHVRRELLFCPKLHISNPQFVF